MLSTLKAVVAVAHALLVPAYHLLARHLDYAEPGADYFDRRHIDRATRRWAFGSRPLSGGASGGRRAPSGRA